MMPFFQWPTKPPCLHRYGFPSRTQLSSMNLIDACAPLQKGLFCDAPQRHKVMRLRTSYSKPSAPINCTPPRNHTGPEQPLAGSSISAIDGSCFGSIGLLVSLSQATSRPEGQSQVWATKCLLAEGLSVLLTRFHTRPCGSQNRANAHKLSTSVNDIVGPRMTSA